MEHLQASDDEPCIHLTHSPENPQRDRNYNAPTCWANQGVGKSSKVTLNIPIEDTDVMKSSEDRQGWLYEGRGKLSAGLVGRRE